MSLLLTAKRADSAPLGVILLLSALSYSSPAMLILRGREDQFKAKSEYCLKLSLLNEFLAKLWLFHVAAERLRAVARRMERALHSNTNETTNTGRRDTNIIQIWVDSA